MAFHAHSFSPSTTYILLLILSSYLTTSTLSQNPRSGPTITQCGTSILPLASCGPFVQGRVASPVQTCCDNLKQVYNQQAGCLCLLLNDSTLTFFPINHTLALQLPLLCNLQVDMSTCPGAPLPSTSPSSQVSLGTKTDSTVAASPMVMVAPRSSIMGFGFHRNAVMDLKTEIRKGVVVAAMASVLTIIIS